MTLKERLEQINYIEENFPVGSLTYKNIKVWPLIRLWLFRNLSYTNNNKPVIIQKKSALSEVRFYLTLFLKTFWSNLKDFRNTSFRLKKADIIYVASVERRTEQIDHKYFSKFADAMFHFLSPSYSFQVLESSFLSNIPTPKYTPAFNLNFRLHSVLFINKFKKSTPENIENFDAFQTFLEQHDLKKELTLTEYYLKREVNLVLGYKAVFVKVLKKINPKIAFLTCFFSKSNFGLTLAANELGIKTIEVQHGQQGDYNNMYASWKNIPKTGYELLPTHFWMWGKRSADRIEKWTTNTNRHHTLIGGNPWLAFYKSHQQTIAKTAQDEKVRILISLQIPALLFESFLGEAIKQSPDNYQWYVRMHPRFTAQQDAIKTYFVKNGGDKIIFEAANTMKIYDLFELVDFHITFWSTTAYEALVFDVPTILIHSNGNDAMKSYVEQGIFKYAKNATELLTAIDERQFKKEKDKYIYADGDLIVRQTNELMMLNKASSK